LIQTTFDEKQNIEFQLPEETVSIYPEKQENQGFANEQNKDYYISVNEPKMVQGQYYIFYTFNFNHLV
jgi:hypothetical protein